MAEKEYIERERIEKFFDGIYDCADLTFEPNDHCCAPDDCAHCKWYEAKNAIKKRILSIPAADVVERKTGKWIDYTEDGFVECPFCGAATNCDGEVSELHYCFNCGAQMIGGDDDV